MEVQLQPPALPHAVDVVSVEQVGVPVHVEVAMFQTQPGVEVQVADEKMLEHVE